MRVRLGMVLAIVSLLAALPVRGQAPGIPASGRIGDVLIDGYLMDGALGNVARTFHVVIGLEDILRPPYDKVLSVHLKHVTAPEAVSALVKADPRYGWRSDANGVIHVYRADGAPDLAGVHLEKFVIRDSYRRDISVFLDTIPEIRGWLRQHKCSRVEFTTGHDWDNDDERVSLSLSHITLREALDQVAEKTGTYFWSVIQFGDPRRCRISVKLN